MVRPRLEALTAGILGLACVVLINLIAGLMPAQLDLTADLRHTLSEVTVDLLNAAQSPIEAQFYRPSNLAAEQAEIADAIEDTLAALRAASPGSLRYTRIDPVDPALSPQEQKARFEAAAAVGIEARDLQTRGADRAKAHRAPFGVVFLSAERQSVVPSVSSARHVEHAMATALRRVVLNLPVPTIGIANGHGEPDLLSSPLAHLLASSGRLKAVTIDGRRVPADVDVLLVFAPNKPFDKAAQAALDAYLARGGSLVLLADYLEQSQVVKDVLVPVSTGLEGLLAHHGLTVQAGMTVVDTEHNAPAPIGRDASGRIVSAHHPLYALSSPIRTEHPITRTLTGLVLPATSPILLGENAQALLNSRPEATLRKAVRSLAPEALGPPVAGQKGPFTVAACVVSAKGPLSSELTASEGATARLAVVTSARRLVAADPKALILLQNMLDWALSSSELAAIRARGQGDPPLRVLSGTARATIRYGTLFGPPLLFLLFVWAVARRRKRAP